MAAQPITLRASTDNELIIQCFADDAETVPFPLDGYEFVAQLKTRPGDDDTIAAFETSVSASEAHPDVNHCLTLYLPENTAEVLNGIKAAWWDVLFIPPAGLSYRPYEASQVIIKQAVSER